MLLTADWQQVVQRGRSLPWRSSAIEAAQKIADRGVDRDDNPGSIDHDDAGMDIVHNRLEPRLAVSDLALALKPVPDALRLVGRERHDLDRKAVSPEDRLPGLPSGMNWIELANAWAWPSRAAPSASLNSISGATS